jgi:hypothetical protein
MAENETLASLLRGRNRAGQPVDATANIIGPAMSALGNTIYGAGRGALTAMAGLPGDINQLITDNLGTLVNAQGLPTTKEIQDFLPAKPTTYEGKLAQKLGEFVPVNPTPIAKSAVAIAKPVGKAMGEQAYRMTEDMLQKQGMMPSIVAYHGTPHNIEGAFDISKVGTGEGAQAYGHGMYYAENPSVATEYQKRLSGKTTFGERPSDSAYVHAVESFREANYPLEQIPAEMKKAYKSITDKDIQLAIQASEKGNLYKVDIPDEYVPKMLDWDKPLLKQSKEVQEALAKLGIKTDKDKLKQFDDSLLDALLNDANKPLPKQPINPTGEDIYNKFVQGNPQITSQKLNEVGIKGIRYLDEGSRNATGGEIIDTFKTPDGWKTKIRVSGRAGTDASGKPISSFTTSMPFKTAEEAKNWAENKISGGTSNFVVFDPKEVKILEKNSKPVSRKETLEKAFEGSMPHYKDYENLASVFEKAGLKIKETGSSKSGSKYVEINDPVSGEILTVRFADHPQTGSAISLHGNADIEIGEPFKNKSWKDAINPILDRINKSRKQYGDELLTINQK